MFYHCSNLKTFNSDLSSLEKGQHMFYKCRLNLKSLENIASTINTLTNSGNLTLGLDKNIKDNPLTNECLETIKQKGWILAIEYN